jgi:hypothetical protein
MISTPSGSIILSTGLLVSGISSIDGGGRDNDST